MQKKIRRKEDGEGKTKTPAQEGSIEKDFRPAPGFFMFGGLRRPVSYANQNAGPPLFLDAFRDVVEETLGVVPAKARIRDGFSVAVLSDLLGTWLKVALNHDALDEVSDVL